MRTHDKVANAVARQLTKQFDNAGTALGTVNALGTAAPATLGARNVAMGITGKNGVVSFIHNAATAIDVTCYFWSSLYQKVVPASKGWHFAAGAAAYYKKNVEPGGLETFVCPEDVPFFLVGSAVATELLVSGREDAANKNTAALHA